MPNRCCDGSLKFLVLFLLVVIMHFYSFFFFFLLEKFILFGLTEFLCYKDVKLKAVIDWCCHWCTTRCLLNYSFPTECELAGCPHDEFKKLVHIVLESSCF